MWRGFHKVCAVVLYALFLLGLLLFIQKRKWKAFVRIIEVVYNVYEVFFRASKFRVAGRESGRK